MKKILLIVGVMLLPMIAIAQNNIIIQQTTNNSQTQYQHQDNVFYIQGVPSSQDVGGVEAVIKGNDSPDPYANPYLKRVVFKNYRNSTVQVYYEFTYGHPRSSNPDLSCEGTIILGPNETKQLERKFNSARNVRMIVRLL